ncbi:polysaccharide transporter, PST family [Pseudomonas cuatrocienegasensis]|uniref:Polysaccharide transporter, PST family n=1 Tax=Pseudomonas cuatrocienegasensis TaxID=543360 RepID=A0ABY1B9S8_9PSED|nr:MULTISPECIES: O-antigen translocase [Pseudomonas]OEC35321.1 polysaccharide biosynthesis protein [Pseudomonas sp. 21C1]SEQ32090.1 polysaccharide transporter, PST family [Pseudomonas cuatrocienegasensis]
MTLIKTSLLNGIAVFIKMLTLLGINKVLAVYVGPIGYAALGQFQSSVQMITSFASGAINTGVTKYTAEYHKDEAKQHAVWRTAGTIALIGSLSTAMLVIILNRTLADWFLKDEKLGSVFVWFASTLVFFVFNTLLLAILNGKKEIRKYVTANISGSIFALIVTSFMAGNFGLYGALVALAIYQSLTFIITSFLIYKTPWFKFKYLVGRIEKKEAKNLAKFTAMALTSAICIPVSHIFIRNHLGQTLGWEVAGYWEAVWRLSLAYLMVVTTTLSVYYLPRLSELKREEVWPEMIYGYKIILPFAVISSLAVYFLRDYLIEFLFSDHFYAARDLFAWQMVGNCLKVGSLIMSYYILSRASATIFIILEVLYSSFFVIFTFLFVEYWGFEGVAVAYAASYALYWLFVTVCISKL